MDRRLSTPRAVRRAGRRRAAFLAVAVLVVLLHLVLSRELVDQMGDLGAARALPQRMTAAYVRTIEPTAPPPAALAATPPPAANRAARAVARPTRAASAPAADAAPAETLQATAAEAPASGPVEAAEALDAAETAVTEARMAAADPAASAAEATAAAASASAPSSSAGYQWPASTRVTYDLTGNYRGELTGQAQVEWLRRGDRYQVHLDLFAGPEFAPIFSRRMSSEGRIEASGLVPERYDEDTQAILRDRRRATVVFEPDAVVLANGQRRERLAGVQDTASQFVQFSFVFSTRPELLRVGNTFELPLALPRGMDAWTYDVMEEVTLATPFGPLNAFHLKPRRAVRKNGVLTAEIWFAPELRYLPVRIRIQQDAANFIDLTIARKPEMAAS